MPSATSAGGVSEFLPLVERGLVVAHHGSASGNISVIDLERRTVAPLVTEPLHAVRAGPAPGDDLWLVPSSRSRLGLLHLGRLVAEEVRLDLPIESVLPLGASTAGKRFVAVDHGHPAGGLTVLDADQPARDNARSLVGFLYTDILEREAP